ncbi:MAG: electron transfer flavoprotein subunit alpha/FixB family protein [Acidilobaceae archaeon]|nr:electron transfer flavoprotein subunit alpha/FixB family protein [Acidilobaceae archaeon]MCX8165035.1 electron transfer flavoprotein subunit alpha/FixB family protein [Acidilobaceae archaeon]MDW7974448.1 electron transfer flavoprotein subunit alpha/FixB family protein [Sulfolobales archaeon]
MIMVVSQAPEDVGELLAVARKLGEPFVLAFQTSAEKVDEVAAYGHKVFRLRSDRPEALFSAANRLYGELRPQLILGPSTKNVRDGLALLAGLHDLPLASEVTQVSDEGSYVRYSRGFMSERVIMTAKVPKPAVLLLKQKAVEPVGKGGKGEVVEVSSEQQGVKLLERRPKQFSGVRIEDAEVVIGVGRGFKSKEDIQLAFELAKALGGQVGATRPIATDLKWLPEDVWIGISGKRIAPKLYFAIGVSGAPQHMAGVSDAKVIVAINKDKAAPIFKYADYGIVGDLYKTLPVLIAKLKRQ